MGCFFPFFFPRAAQIVVLQVNKKEQKYIHLMNGEWRVEEGLKWEFIERSMKYVRLFVPFLFIDFSGFPFALEHFFLSCCSIAVNTEHCNAVSLFSNFFSLARSNDFTFLSLFFIISFSTSFIRGSLFYSVQRDCDSFGWMPAF